MDVLISDFNFHSIESFFISLKLGTNRKLVAKSIFSYFLIQEFIMCIESYYYIKDNFKSSTLSNNAVVPLVSETRQLFKYFMSILECRTN